MQHNELLNRNTDALYSLDNKVLRETLLTLERGPDHMERVSNGGALHALTGSAAVKSTCCFYADLFQLL